MTLASLRILFIKFIITLISMFFWALLRGQNAETPLPYQPQLNQITQQNSPLLEQLFKTQSASFQKIIHQAEKYKLQIIWTQINRDEQNRPYLLHHTYKLDTLQFFYPASMVKVPCAALTLEKLNELKISELDKNTPVKIDASGECSPANANNEGRNGTNYPDLAFYIKDAFVASGNTPYNRLYEFLGQQYLNEKLKAKGYQAQITQRYGGNCGQTENRLTNAMTFIKSGRTIYRQPAQTCEKSYKRYDLRGLSNAGPAIMDFSAGNYVSLASLHEMILAIIAPETMSLQKQFLLKPDDYTLLRKYMGMTPPESTSPAYEPGYFNYGRLKYLLYGNSLKAPDPNLRVFNKVGLSFGYLTDCAYVVDFENNTEFFLSATIYLNENGSENYEYLSVGMPFLQQLGQIILDYERARTKPFKPDLSAFRFDYKND